MRLLIGELGFICGQKSRPSTSEKLATTFFEATAAEIHQAVTLADSAFPAYRKLSKEQRADFLDRIAEEILGLGDELIQCANAESGLPLDRLTGERGRTMNQLKMFASLVREGSWVEASIDTAIPDRAPVPKPDLRKMLRPLGPVAVFGASNFPLAFSTAGGDTASALVPTRSRLRAYLPRARWVRSHELKMARHVLSNATVRRPPAMMRAIGNATP